MASKKTVRDVLLTIRRGIRLKTKPPKTETPKSVYNRKIKHRRRPEDLLFFIPPFFYVFFTRLVSGIGLH
ncbi:MAG: hypothetical protein MUD12_15765 [Spirochaetes bacterium]|nr:hypothetical protein [Spirochaetota bacterium]